MHADPSCPKEFSFSFCFKCKQREFTFACKSKEERDSWLSSFQMLNDFRQILANQQKESITNMKMNRGSSDVISSQLNDVSSVLQQQRDLYQPIDQSQNLLFQQNANLQ